MKPFIGLIELRGTANCCFLFVFHIAQLGLAPCQGPSIFSCKPWCGLLHAQQASPMCHPKWIPLLLPAQLQTGLTPGLSRSGAALLFWDQTDSAPHSAECLILRKLHECLSVVQYSICTSDCGSEKINVYRWQQKQRKGKQHQFV